MKNLCEAHRAWDNGPTVQYLCSGDYSTRMTFGGCGHFRQNEQHTDCVFHYWSGWHGKYLCNCVPAQEDVKMSQLVLNRLEDL